MKNSGEEIGTLVILYIKVSDSDVWRLKDPVVPKQIKKLMRVSRERNVSAYVQLEYQGASYTIYIPSFFQQLLN